MSLGSQGETEQKNTQEDQSDDQAILKKLERLNEDQEQLIKQLQKLAKEEEKIEAVEQLVNKTLEKVNQSQQVAIEKVDNLQSDLDKISNNHRRLNYIQNELKIEITNRTFLLNELNKDLNELSSFIRSNRMPSKLINEKLDELSKELFVIGINQNTFQNNLDIYKNKLFDEIKRMSTNLSAIDKKI